MNKRQVIILWVIAILLGVAVTIVKLNQSEANQSATARARGQTLFESLPVNNAAAIEVQGADESVSLANKNGKWVVTNRADYPANSTFVNDLLRTLADLKVTLGMQAGPKLAPRFGMDESASKPEERGLTATIKDASGTEIAKVSLGKNIDSNASESPMGMGGGSVGRYVRNHADESGFYAVSEMFPSVSADPKRWLAEGFINPEKIKSITVSQPGKSEPAWKLTRDGEEAEFKLDGATATELVDTTATSPLKSIFSYARFDDVVPADKVTERAVADQKRTATIETFEGFVYTIGMTPTKPAATPPAEGEASDNFLITVDVTAELPKERKKEEGEKPEDAKTKDTAFTDRLKALTDKLAKEKAFAGITFELGKTSVDALLKDRTSLIAKATQPAADATPPSPVQGFPGGMIAPAPGNTPPPSVRATATTPPVSATSPPIEAVTPPVSIPATDETKKEEKQD